MQSVWKSARPGGMPPVEQAVVLATIMLLVSGTVFAFDTESKGEPVHWYEIVATVAAMIVMGLVSDWSVWARCLVGGSVLLLDSLGFDMAFSRPEAFAPSAVWYQVAMSLLFAAVLPLLDPPAGLRRLEPSGGAGHGRSTIFSARSSCSASSRSP